MKRLLGLISLLGWLGCLVSGSVVGPDYQSPTAKVERRWLQYEDPRLSTNPPVEPLWWKEAFLDPVLDQLVDEALAGNLTLRSAGLRVLQASQQLAIVKGTVFLQKQFVGATAAVVDPGANTGAFGVYGLNFNLTWEMDVWGRIRREIQSASAACDALLSGYDGVIVSLVSEVAQTYLLIRTTEQRLDVARQNVAHQEESVRVSRAKFEAGDTSSLDVEQARTLFHNTKASAALQEQSRQQLKIALGILLEQTPQGLLDQLQKPGAIPAVSPVIGVGMPQNLIRRRPDIRVAERQLAAQSAQIGVALADLYPQLAFTGLIGPAIHTATGREFSELFNAENVTYNFGGVPRWNILNYGRIEKNIRLQDATFQQLLDDCRQFVLRAQADVESSLAAFFLALVQLRTLQQPAEAAGRAATVSFEQYQEGLVLFNTLFSTPRALLDQQDPLASIPGTVMVNLVAVYRSLAGGWEIRQSNNAEVLIPKETQEEMRAREKYWNVIQSDALVGTA